MKKTTGKSASSTAARKGAKGKAAAGAGWRKCQAPGCGSSFRPRSDRQIYCSPACKVRAFYWQYKENEGERYAARYERQRRKAATRGTKAGARKGAARRKGATSRKRA